MLGSASGEGRGDLDEGWLSMSNTKLRFNNKLSCNSFRRPRIGILIQRYFVLLLAGIVPTGQ